MDLSSALPQKVRTIFVGDVLEEIWITVNKGLKAAKAITQP